MDETSDNQKPVNVAMVGLGFGAEFLPIYQAHPNAHVAAICRRNEVELNKVGDALGIEKRYTEFEDVLADPSVDFVHINSPIDDHAWMSMVESGRLYLDSSEIFRTPSINNSLLDC